jgi:hypothetical protein
MMVRPLILWVSYKNPVFQFLISLTLWHKFIPPLNLTFLVFRCIPTEVSINEKALIRDVRCGVDGTMFITDVGSVYACGNNMDNKLGLNNRFGFIMAMKNIFTKVRFTNRITAVLKSRQTLSLVWQRVWFEFLKTVHACLKLYGDYYDSLMRPFLKG